MKNQKTYAWLLLALFALNGCKRTEDPVFEENPALRMTEAVQHAHKVLRDNADGWLMKYYPAASKEFGGYTLFAKFISDGEVTLTSDINANPVTSSYAVIPGRGAVLTFNGYNKVIHFFSEPGADSGVGSNDRGMQGDFEFVVIEATAEKVVLKGKKSGNIIEMEPLQAATAAQVVADYQADAEFFDDFVFFKIKRPNGQGEDLITSLRTFKLSSDANYPAMSFRVVPGGLELSEEYELDGLTFDRLARKAPTAEYPLGYYTDASEGVVIYPVETPMNWWFSRNLWSMSYSNVGPTGAFFWNTAKTELGATGHTLSNFYIGYVNASWGTGLVFRLNDGANVGFAELEVSLIQGTTDEVKLTQTGLYNMGGFTFAHWNAGLSDLVPPFNGRTFKITPEESSNQPRVILLTDTGIPTNTFRLFLDEIDDPMNN